MYQLFLSAPHQPHHCCTAGKKMHRIDPLPPRTELHPQMGQGDRGPRAFPHRHSHALSLSNNPQEFHIWKTRAVTHVYIPPKGQKPQQRFKLSHTSQLSRKKEWLSGAITPQKAEPWLSTTCDLQVLRTGCEGGIAISKWKLGFISPFLQF